MFAHVIKSTSTVIAITAWMRRFEFRAKARRPSTRILERAPFLASSPSPFGAPGPAHWRRPASTCAM
jgi:hypothetical protein